MFRVQKAPMIEGNSDSALQERKILNDLKKTQQRRVIFTRKVNACDTMHA